MRVAFHDVIFPERIAFGSTGGPSYRTQIAQMASGFEHRNTSWQYPRRQYNLTSGTRSLADLRVLSAFFEARQGRLYGFLWRDWLDYSTSAEGRAVSATDQILTDADKARRTYRLYKTSTLDGRTVKRRIHKPKADTVRVARNGTPLTRETQYTLDAVRGTITLKQAASSNDKITAGFEYYVPVRFDTDSLDIQLVSFNSGNLPSVPLIELRLPE